MIHVRYQGLRPANLSLSYIAYWTKTAWGQASSIRADLEVDITPI